MLDDKQIGILERLQPIADPELCRIMHTENLGLVLFAHRELMRLYLVRYAKGTMDGPLELGFERINQAYKKFKTELDEVGHATQDAYWLERYINNAMHLTGSDFDGYTFRLKQ